MATIDGTRFLERQRFFNGQRLFASDLQGLEEFHREMRWLHNQSLHQPGVGAGYAVAGAIGSSEVTIAPGYAIDARGREIVLVESVVEPVPPVANDGFGAPVFYDLTVSYPADSELEESETRDGICLPRGVVRLEERPVLCWIRLGPPPELQPVDDVLKSEIQSGLRIRLARAEIFNCTLKSALSVAQRRNARPPEQPYVACGTESLENVEVEAAEGENDSVIAFAISVDTSSAGFRTRPCYFAGFVGPRLLTTSEGDRFGILGLTSVAIPEAAPLTRLEITFVGSLLAFSGEVPTPSVVAAIVRESWRIDWIGVEG